MPRLSPTISPTRSGFTLIEAVMAIAISALILGTLQSLIVVAAKTTPTDASAPTVALKTAANLDYFATDIACATQFVTLTPTVAEFYTPDRNGDDEPDLVRYEWSGVAGAPLLRKYTCDENVAYDTATAVVPAVASLSFLPSYRRTTSTTTTGGASLGGGSSSVETLVDSYEVTASSNTRSITSTRHTGQVFVPTLAADATSFRVTRVALRLAKSGTTTGTFDVALRQASNGVPSSTVLTKATIAESSLGSAYAWTNIALPDCPDLLPTQQYCITVNFVANSTAGKLNVRTKNSVNTKSTMYTSTNGSTWSATTKGSMLFRVYAVATVPTSSTSGTATTTTTTTTTSVAGLTVRLTPSASGSKSFESFFPALNHPEAP